MPDLTEPVRRHVLQDGDVSVAILDLGCITQDWQVPVGGERVPVVLGFRNPEDYLHNPAFMGAIIGRVANRTAGASFEWGGRAYALDPNDAPHHLHGGSQGLHMQRWEMEPDGHRAVRLRHRSLAGTMGYPGTVTIEVTISLTAFTLSYEMIAWTDQPTPINLTQHSYYALMQGHPVWDQRLEIKAGAVTPVDDRLIPDGEVLPVDGEPFDLRQPRRIDQLDPHQNGIDLNYVLDPAQDPTARLEAPNGLTLTLWTDQPGLQLFTGGNLTATHAPLPGQRHAAFSGLCLEPQGFPNSANMRQFPSIMIDPDRPYSHRTKVRIAPDTLP